MKASRIRQRDGSQGNSGWFSFAGLWFGKTKQRSPEPYAQPGYFSAFIITLYVYFFFYMTGESSDVTIILQQTSNCANTTNIGYGDQLILGTASDASPNPFVECCTGAMSCQTLSLAHFRRHGSSGSMCPVRHGSLIPHPLHPPRCNFCATATLSIGCSSQRRHLRSTTGACPTLCGCRLHHLQGTSLARLPMLHPQGNITPTMLEPEEAAAITAEQTANTATADVVVPRGDP